MSPKAAGSRSRRRIKPVNGYRCRTRPLNGHHRGSHSVEESRDGHFRSSRRSPTQTGAPLGAHKSITAFFVPSMPAHCHLNRDRPSMAALFHLAPRRCWTTSRVHAEYGAVVPSEQVLPHLYLVRVNCGSVPNEHGARFATRGQRSAPIFVTG